MDEKEGKNFSKYLETHRLRIVNYHYYQQEGISIGSGAVFWAVSSDNGIVVPDESNWRQVSGQLRIS